MGWAVGENNEGRDIGYGVPCVCDHPGCDAQIHRGVAYVCGDMHDGDEHGCGRYLCADHMRFTDKAQLCERCIEGAQPFDAKPDTDEWINHKETCPTWAKWREERDVKS